MTSIAVFLAVGVGFVLLLRKVAHMSALMDSLNAKIGKLEVSASNLVSEVQGLKAQVVTLSAGQEDGPGLQAAIARLDVVQAAIDAVATPSVPAPAAPADPVA